MADMEEIGLPLVAAAAIAGYFGNVNTNTSLEQEPGLELEPELQEPELEVPELEGRELEEQEPGSTPGPMVHFDEAAVLAGSPAYRG
jgi:hypothetical protein